LPFEIENVPTGMSLLLFLEMHGWLSIG
jgi:hypothetical protein